MFSRISFVVLNLTNTFFFSKNTVLYSLMVVPPPFFFYYNTYYFLETKNRNAINLIHINLNHFPPNIVYVKYNAFTLPLRLKSNFFLLHQRIFCTPPVEPVFIIRNLVLLFRVTLNISKGTLLWFSELSFATKMEIYSDTLEQFIL